MNHPATANETPTEQLLRAAFDSTKSKEPTLFSEETERGRKNNARIKELQTKYGQEYADKQLAELMQDPKLHGNINGAEIKKGCYPGMHFSIAATAYLAERVLVYNNKNKAYSHFLQTVELLADQISADIEEYPHLPTQEQMQDLISKYLERFRKKAHRLKIEFQEKSTPPANGQTIDNTVTSLYKNPER